MLSRRTLLVAGAAAAAMPKMALAADKSDVVIIGAGLSGLHSATLLREMGYKVVVLEANDRVGGRVRTHETEFGRQDVGASQVGRSYARVLDACRRYNLELTPQDRDLLPFTSNMQGQWIDHAKWESHSLNRLVGEERKILPFALGNTAIRNGVPLKNLEDWLDPKFAGYDTSIRTLMQRMGYSGEAIRLAAMSGIDDTSVLRLAQESVRGGYDARFGDGSTAETDTSVYNNLPPVSNIKGGCDLLPRAMHAGLGDAVRLNKKVVRIEMTDTSATVTCSDGSVYNSRFLISAVPFAVLRNVEIMAKPGGATQQAVNEMAYGNTARMYFRIKRPFWKDDGMAPSFFTDTALGQFWVIDNHKGDGEHRGMIVMTGKWADAITSRPESGVEQFLVSEIERLRPAAKGLIKVATYKNWGADPLQRGCGFMLAPGQVNLFARDMLTPWQVMHFAGEHTRRMDFGMEGAMESAERVALELAERA